MRRKKIWTPTLTPIFLVLLLWLAAAGMGFGQAGSGGISGIVTDSTGAIVPGAKVTARNVATDAKISTVSTGGGLYSFISLAPGSYEISAEEKGFETLVRKNIVVTVDQVTTVNLALHVGSASEVVTVTETTDLLDTSNSTVGQLISAQTIDRVPLLDRNVYDLIQLSAGVTPANGTPSSSGSFAIENISSGRPGVDVSSYTINGAIEGSVYYMVDGSPLGIAENNAAAIIPAMDLPEDAVDEVRVETQSTPASYQSGGAGVISVATKSGTEHFHGDAFGVFRPDILAANEYFNKQNEIENGQANTPPSFHRYQEGGAIGGPITRNRKFFFFGDYEATQQQQYDGSNYFTVPTSAERTGDFSADNFTIYDPTQPDIATGPLAGTRQPFLNNKIANPNPIGVKFLSEMPKCNVSPATCDTDPNGTLNNFFLPGLDPTTAQKFDVRVDWAKSQAQRIFGRFSFDRLFTSTFNAFNNMWDLNYAQNVTNGRNVLLADDYTINPTTVLQLRYSFTRHYENQGGDPGQVGYDITQLGFPSALAAQEVYKLLPFMVFNDVGGGVGGTANYNTFIFASETNDASATLTKLFGKHEVAAGFEYMKRLLNVGQPIAPSGSYLFDVSATDQTSNLGGGGSDFASLLIGMGTEPGTESDDYPNFSKDLFAAEASPYYAAFVQDTWRPASKFTVTAGVRWDIFGGRTERHNRLEYFNPTAQNTVSGVAYTGAEVYVGNGSSRTPFTTNYANLGPRLGFSWQVAPRLVIRGGGGVNFGPSAQMVGSSSLNSDGYATYTTWNATAWNEDPNTIAYDCAQDSDLCGNDNGNTVMVSSLSNPFPNGVVQTISAPKGLGNNLGTTLNTMLHSQRTTTTYNFNFGWEYEFPQQVVLSLGYVGSRGLFLPLGSVDLNQLDLGTIEKYGADLLNVQVANQWEAIDDPTNANYGSDTVPEWVALQPFPQFGNGSYGAGNGVNVHGYPGGDSEYSSLQTKLQKRLTNHFTMLAGLTWSKLMTDDGNPPLGFVGSHLGTPQDWRNMKYEHSVSPQDVKLQFTGQASYDLPVGKGRALNLTGVGNAVAGGWTVNGIVYLSSGIPVASPLVGAATSYFNQRPNLSCNPGANAPHTAAQWFNFNCFVNPASAFVPGSAPAYLSGVRTMGAKDLDLSLYKKISLGESRDVRIEVSSYNVTNRAQLGMPNVPTTTDAETQPSVAATVGQITTTVNSPRQFQFGARFTF